MGDETAEWNKLWRIQYLSAVSPKEEVVKEEAVSTIFPHIVPTRKSMAGNNNKVCVERCGDQSIPRSYPWKNTTAILDFFRFRSATSTSYLFTAMCNVACAAPNQLMEMLLIRIFLLQDFKICFTRLGARFSGECTVLLFVQSMVLYNVKQCIVLTSFKLTYPKFTRMHPQFATGAIRPQQISFICSGSAHPCYLLDNDFYLSLGNTRPKAWP